jgi:hypothetical protein
MLANAPLACCASVAAISTLPPAAWISAAMVSSRSRRRAPSTTCAPKLARCRAVASPMPLLGVRSEEVVHPI